METSNGKISWKYGLAWSQELETGNETIDSQHKQLFKLISDIVEACMNGKDADVPKKALDFLASYTVKHFADEEALQLQYGFPDYERHKKIHDDFKVTAAALVEEYNSELSLEKLNSKIHSVVIHWLTRHIKGEDAKIAAHIRKQAKTQGV
ncbi:hemerythrin [Synergistales bacterium]|nr:hemerythrin [Synergistales bacterium]